MPNRYRGPAPAPQGGAERTCSTNTPGAPGLGIDRHNNIVYVAGNYLNLSTLAVALAEAGAVRGMELDMHNGMSLFTTWRITSTGPTPTKLLATMPSSASRYLAPDRRDFFYATTRQQIAMPPASSGERSRSSITHR